MSEKIWLSSPHMGEKEQQFVKEAFDTNWIAPLGPHVNGFESDLQEYNNIQHVAALMSGTSALHLGLILLGVGTGDIVLCQSFTFSASANPIVYQGAEPVFIDSEQDTWNMDPIALRTAIEDLIEQGKKHRLKAIVPVHLYGMPAKMDEIMAISKEFGIPVLEDAAEALGSHINGKKCGTFGDLGVYSFNGNKIITTSGGGALASNNKELIEKARFLSTQARDVAPHYQHSNIGYNYRLSNVLAGIGRGQMQVLGERIEQRRAMFEFYTEIFSNISGVNLLKEPKGYFSNRWLTTILVDSKKTGGVSREVIRLQLEQDNIESRPLWKPMHLQPVYENSRFYGSGVCEMLFENGLCLPSSSNLDEEDRNRIKNNIKLIFSNAL
ncbi:aminotransferase class I/II-fold pyridoxal phosphate-dependent enzyme [bacterium]|nr:aminotransferase class I/II-fold pyridoxal phosphate-dependent enzyme [bacterium]